MIGFLSPGMIWPVNPRSRLENNVSRSDFYRVGLTFRDTFIESYDKPPTKITLDIDDPTHGSQQLPLFHAYYKEYCRQLTRSSKNWVTSDGAGDGIG